MSNEMKPTSDDFDKAKEILMNKGMEVVPPTISMTQLLDKLIDENSELQAKLEIARMRLELVSEMAALSGDRSIIDVAENALKEIER